MKFASTILLITVSTVLSASVTSKIDWSKVTPLDVKREVPNITYHPVPEGRITNGNLAVVKQFPYQVGLFLYVPQTTSWCGGTIISNRWIVTAAHCTYSLTIGLDVYLGTLNRTNHKEEGQQIIFVSKRYIIEHEEWDSSSIINDIALVKLPAPIEFNDYIQPAKLPKRSEFLSYDNVKAIASGWGSTSDVNPGYADTLRWIEVTTMTNSECSTWFHDLVKSTNICIKTTGGISICSGDSGGPLVLADGSNTVIGVTSFGSSSGCEKGWPGVFSRVSSYLDWIEEKSGVTNK